MFFFSFGVIFRLFAFKTYCFWYDKIKYCFGQTQSGTRRTCPASRLLLYPLSPLAGHVGPSERLPLSPPAGQSQLLPHLHLHKGKDIPSTPRFPALLSSPPPPSTPGPPHLHLPHTDTLCPCPGDPATGSGIRDFFSQQIRKACALTTRAKWRHVTCPLETLSAVHGLQTLPDVCEMAWEVLALGLLYLPAHSAGAPTGHTLSEVLSWGVEPS